MAAVLAKENRTAKILSEGFLRHTDLLAIKNAIDITSAQEITTAFKFTTLDSQQKLTLCWILWASLNKNNNLYHGEAKLSSDLKQTSSHNRELILMTQNIKIFPKAEIFALNWLVGTLLRVSQKKQKELAKSQSDTADSEFGPYDICADSRSYILWYEILIFSKNSQPRTSQEPTNYINKYTDQKKDISKETTSPSIVHDNESMYELSNIVKLLWVELLNCSEITKMWGAHFDFFIPVLKSWLFKLTSTDVSELLLLTNSSEKGKNEYFTTEKLQDILLISEAFRVLATGAENIINPKKMFVLVCDKLLNLVGGYYLWKKNFETLIRSDHAFEYDSTTKEFKNLIKATELNMNKALGLSLFRTDTISAYTSVISDNDIQLRWKNSLDDSDVVGRDTAKKLKFVSLNKSADKKIPRMKLQVYQSRLFEKIDEMIQTGPKCDQKNTISYTESEHAVWELIPVLIKIFIDSAALIHKAKAGSLKLSTAVKDVYNVKVIGVTDITLATSTSASENFGVNSLKSLVFLFFSKFYAQVTDLITKHISRFEQKNIPIDQKLWNSMTLLVSAYVNDTIFGINQISIISSTDLIHRKQLKLIEHWISNVISPLTRVFTIKAVRDESFLPGHGRKFVRPTDLVLSTQVAISANPMAITSDNTEWFGLSNLSAIIHYVQLVSIGGEKESKNLLKDILHLFTQSRQTDTILSNIIKNIYNFESLAADFSSYNAQRVKDTNLLTQKWFLLNLMGEVIANLPPSLVPQLIGEFTDSILNEIAILLLNEKSNLSQSTQLSKKRSSNSPTSIFSGLRLEALVLIFVHFLHASVKSSTTFKQYTQLSNQFSASVSQIMPQIYSLADENSLTEAKWSYLMLVYEIIETMNQNSQAESWAKEFTNPSTVNSIIKMALSVDNTSLNDDSYPQILILSVLTSFKTLANTVSSHASYDSQFGISVLASKDKADLDTATSTLLMVFEKAVAYGLKDLKTLSKNNSLNKTAYWDGFPHTINKNNFLAAFYKICTDWVALLVDINTEGSDFFEFFVQVLFESFKSPKVGICDSSNTEESLEILGYNLQQITLDLLNRRDFFEIQKLQSWIIPLNIKYLHDLFSTEASEHRKKSCISRRLDEFLDMLGRITSSFKMDSQPQLKNKFDAYPINKGQVVKFLFQSLEFDSSTLSSADDALGLFSTDAGLDQSAFLKKLLVFENQIHLWNQFPMSYFPESHIWLTVAICISFSKTFAPLLKGKSGAIDLPLVYRVVLATNEWVYKCLNSDDMKDSYKAVLLEKQVWASYLLNQLESEPLAAIGNKSLHFDDFYSSEFKLLALIHRKNVETLFNKEARDSSAFCFEFLNSAFNVSNHGENDHRSKTKLLITMVSTLNMAVHSAIAKSSATEAVSNSLGLTPKTVESLTTISGILLKEHKQILESISYDYDSLDNPIPSTYSKVILSAVLESTIQSIGSLLPKDNTPEDHTSSLFITLFCKALGATIKKLIPMSKEGSNIDDFASWVSIAIDLSVILCYSYNNTKTLQMNLGSIGKLQGDSEGQNKELKHTQPAPFSQAFDTGNVIAFCIQSFTSINVLASRISLQEASPFGTPSHHKSSNSFNILNQLFTPLLFGTEDVLSLKDQIDLSKIFKNTGVSDAFNYFIKNAFDNTFSLVNDKVHDIILPITNMILKENFSLLLVNTEITNTALLIASSVRLKSLIIALDRALVCLTRTKSHKLPHLFPTVISTLLHCANYSILSFSEGIILLDVLSRMIVPSTSYFRVSANEISVIFDIISTICSKPLLNWSKGTHHSFGGAGELLEKSVPASMFTGCCKVLSSCFKYYPEYTLRSIPSIIIILRSLLHCFVSVSKVNNDKSQQLRNLYSYSSLPNSSALDYSRLIDQFVNMRVEKSSTNVKNSAQLSDKFSRSKLGSKSTVNTISSHILSKYTPLILAEYCIIMGGALIDLDSRANTKGSSVASEHLQHISVIEVPKVIQLSQQNENRYNNQQPESMFRWALNNTNYSLQFLSSQWRPAPLSIGLMHDSAQKNGGIAEKASAQVASPKKATDSNNINANKHAQTNIASENQDQRTEKLDGVIYGIINDPSIRDSLSQGLYAVLDTMTESDRNSLMYSLGNSANAEQELSVNKSPYKESEFDGLFDVAKVYKAVKDKNLITSNSYISTNWSGSKEVLKALYSDYLQFYKFKGSY